MSIYHGQNVSTAEDVDRVTVELIHAAAGGVDEQLKMLRKAIKAVAVLGNARRYPEYAVSRAQKTAAEMQVIDDQIELIVGEGKEFKIRNGLA